MAPIVWTEMNNLFGESEWTIEETFLFSRQKFQGFIFFGTSVLIDRGLVGDRVNINA